MPNTHIVLKALPAGAKTYKPGDRVDASKWLNRATLEDGQWAYIRRLSAADGKDEPEKPEGRTPRRKRAKPRARSKA